MTDRYLVATVPEGFASAECVTLPDPSTGDPRMYLLDNQKKLAEVQALDAPYSSFLVDSTAISNGKLYTISPMDPLFWCLQDSTNNWQPLDQLIRSWQLSPVLQDVLLQRKNKSWTRHLLDRKSLAAEGEDEDEDNIFYKFSSSKALEWLKAKQERVQGVLLKQHQRRRNGEQAQQDSSAFSSSFQKKTRDENQRPVKETDRQQTEEQLARKESLQIVCQYLNAAWRTRFLEFLKEPANMLDEPTKVQAISSDWNASLVAGDQQVSVTEKKVAPTMTAGAKRLAKVNTKGMRKMSNFFGVKKAKTQ